MRMVTLCFNLASIAKANPKRPERKGLLRVRSPDDCRTMAEVRAGVDALDDELVALLRRRFDYMDAAARIKAARSEVRDEARKAEVIANARAKAEALGLPGSAIASLWDRLVEASIAYELDAFDRVRA
jgi:isochorismate pyruvate lyase